MPSEMPSLSTRSEMPVTSLSRFRVVRRQTVPVVIQQSPTSVRGLGLGGQAASKRPLGNTSRGPGVTLTAA